MTEFLLDTEAASRLLRAERSALASMRRSGATALSVSSVTMAELVYGNSPQRGSSSRHGGRRRVLGGSTCIPWDADAAEAHARIRVFAKRHGRSAGVLNVMIAAHALARGVTLISRDAAIKNLAIDGLTIVRW